MTLGAQVRHLVTYREPPEGTLVYTGFTKKCQKRCKKGVPPVFNRVFECTHKWVSFPARRLVETQFALRFWVCDGGQKRLLGVCSPVHPLNDVCIQNGRDLGGGCTINPPLQSPYIPLHPLLHSV